MRFLDTDILLYSISRDPAEAQKRERAIALIEESGNALSVQVLQEFYVQATRPTRADPVPHDLAVGLMRTWLRFPVQDITLSVMSAALEIKARFGLSYWDSAIVAAADAIGCDEIASEDMTHGQQVGSVTIRNPF